MKTLINMLFPAQCASCDTEIVDDMGLCPSCWADTNFIVGGVCDCCGAPLLGEVEDGDLCDICVDAGFAWSKGRAAMVYGENARRLVLALKHGDRTELAKTTGAWLARAAKPLVTPQTVVVPVPIHWTRLLKRKYNQAELLAHEVADVHGLTLEPDALKRVARTPPLDDLSGPARHEAMAQAIVTREHQRATLAGRPVLLVDDVMTSGATLSACTHALHEIGVARVDVAVLTRVVCGL